MENTIISTLPREVWLICFEYLPLKDIRPCLFVSKSFSSLATSPILWYAPKFSTNFYNNQRIFRENRLRRDYGELTAEERKEEEARPIRRTPLQLYFAIKESRLHTGWYQYIIQLEAQCHKALIFGKDNGVAWACSKGFNPTSREILVLCTSMKDGTRHCYLFVVFIILNRFRPLCTAAKGDWLEYGRTEVHCGACGT